MIRTSSTKDVNVLLADLESETPAVREAAVARLTVIGTRAVQRLIATAERADGPASSRSAAFRALEHIGDGRAIDAALRAVEDADSTVAVSAISVAATFLTGPEGVRVLDRLIAAALNRTQPTRVRMAAIVAIESLKSRAVAKALSTLVDDPDPAIAAAVAPAKSGRSATPILTLEALAQQGLADDPAVVRRAIAREGGTAPVTALSHLVTEVRTRESGIAEGRQGEWTTLRAALHVSLAQRGSRLALYDLRETIESAKEPVAVEFLTALGEIGDASCLEAIAAAYATASARTRPDEWWRRHLIDAFRTIVRRERLTKRQAAVKRVWARWGKAAAELWPGS